MSLTEKILRSPAASRVAFSAKSLVPIRLISPALEVTVKSPVPSDPAVNSEKILVVEPD